jgi:hypothetical protein
MLGSARRRRGGGLRDARLPNVEELGLDHAGVRLGDDGRVTVDQQQRTSAAGIYAAGDVTGPPWLTNRAVTGTVAGGNALGEPDRFAASAAGRRVATPTVDLASSARSAILGDPRGRCIPPWRRWLAWPSAWTTSPGMRDRRQAQRRDRSA